MRGSPSLGLALVVPEGSQEGNESNESSCADNGVDVPPVGAGVDGQWVHEDGSNEDVDS